MKTWTRRLVTTGAVAAGIVGLSAAAVNAAPPLPTATAGRLLGGHATALGIPGVVTVSESTAQAGSEPHWTALSVAGTEVLGRAYTGWTGPAAGLGNAIDATNNALCRSVPVGDAASVGVCGDVAGTYMSQSGNGYRLADGEVARGVVIVDAGPRRYAAGAAVLPAFAQTTEECGGRADATTSLATLAVQNGNSITDVPIAGSTASTGC